MSHPALHPSLDLSCAKNIDEEKKEGGFVHSRVCGGAVFMR